MKKPALDPETIEPRIGSSYPEPYAADCATRAKRPLGDALGLTQFGVNLVTLPPGCWASQRHWHSREDEFVYIVSGEVISVTDGGEQALGPGMVAGYPAGVEDGHHLVNRSDEDAVYLEIGARDEGDEADYPDIDMLIRLKDGLNQFIHKDGRPYSEPFERYKKSPSGEG